MGNQITQQQPQSIVSISLRAPQSQPNLTIRTPSGNIYTSGAGGVASFIYQDALFALSLGWTQINLGSTTFGQNYGLMTAPNGRPGTVFTGPSAITYTANNLGQALVAQADIGYGLSLGWTQSVPTNISNATARRRQEMTNWNVNAALIQAPAWSNNGGAGTAYGQGKIVRLTGGQLIVCTTAGTGSTTSAPTFSSTSLMSDGTVTWAPIARVTRLASGREIPTITASASNPFSQLLNPFSGSAFLNSFATSNFSANLSFPVTPFYIASGGNFCYTFYNNGSNNLFTGITNTQGFTTGMSMMEFLSDAPAIAIWGAISNAGSGGPFFGWVGEEDGSNMFLIEESTTQLGTAGGTAFYVITWPGGRKWRRYRFESGGCSNLFPGSLNFIGVGVDSQTTVAAIPSIDGLRGILIADSMGITSSPSNSADYSHMHGTLAMKYAGIRYTQYLSQASAGYLSGSTVWGSSSSTVQLPLLFQAVNNAFAPSVGFVPDVVVFTLGFNDWIAVPAQIQAAALASFQGARAQWPNAFMIVFGPQNGDHNSAASALASEAAILAAFNQWGDAFSVFFPVLNDPAGAWVTGTGHYGSTTGVGNGDFYVGSDGVHPPGVGHDYISARMGRLIDQAMTAFGL